MCYNMYIAYINLTSCKTILWRERKQNTNEIGFFFPFLSKLGFTNDVRRNMHWDVEAEIRQLHLPV